MYQRIKNAVTIEQVLLMHDIKIVKNRAKCPFHDDKNPSMVIFKKTNTAVCMTCRSGGDVIAIVSKLFGLTNYNACRKISNDFNLGIFKQLDEKEIVIFKEKELERKKALQTLREREEERLKRLEMFVYYDKLCIKNKPDMHGISNAWLIFNEMRERYWDQIWMKD